MKLSGLRSSYSCRFLCNISAMVSFLRLTARQTRRLSACTGDVVALDDIGQVSDLLQCRAVVQVRRPVVLQKVLNTDKGVSLNGLNLRNHRSLNPSLFGLRRSITSRVSLSVALSITVCGPKHAIHRATVRTPNCSLVPLACSITICGQPESSSTPDRSLRISRFISFFWGVIVCDRKHYQGPFTARLSTNQYLLRRRVSYACAIHMTHNGCELPGLFLALHECLQYYHTRID